MQESFAKIGGVTIDTQVNYEKGERFPNADYLMRLAKDDFDVNYLLPGKRIRNGPHSKQGQLLDFYDEANTDARVAVFDSFMIKQSGEPLRQTLLYRQNVLEYLTGYRIAIHRKFQSRRAAEDSTTSTAKRHNTV